MQTEYSSTVSEMSNPDAPPVDLRRSVAMHRAAQVLADATRCRHGLSPLPLLRLPADDREWFKQAARNVIEIFEKLTTEREPDSVVSWRVSEAAKVARALESHLSQERSRGRFLAAERGHDLTSWAPAGTVDGEERATCSRCIRVVTISLASDPVLSGSALTEGCLAAAEKETL